MALIRCEECGKEVSEKAVACPGCGAPIAAAPPHQPSATSSDARVRVTRTGGKWEAIGFLLIMGGVVTGMGFSFRLGMLAAIVGLVVFIVGRFK
jgi:predicted cobalt transporter CbtA